MFLLFDIGATQMRVAGTRDCKTFTREPVVQKTPQTYKEGIVLLEKTLTEILGGETAQMIAGGIAGPFDQERGCLVGGRNIPGWFEEPIRDDLEEAFKTHVEIENDAAVVGLGEMHFGTGTTKGIAAYITVSTGVGGARYEDGELDRHELSFEPGHQLIDPDRSMCPDCESGELESYIGGAATERRMGKKPYEITDPGFWDTYAKYLAYGLNNMIMHWTPGVVVLGGSMVTGDPAISVEATERHLAGILRGRMPELRKASLGDFGGLYGAMVLVKHTCDV